MDQRPKRECLFLFISGQQINFYLKLLTITTIVYIQGHYNNNNNNNNNNNFILHWL